MTPKGHYDGVIHNFREMHITKWPENDVPGLSPLLDRLRNLCPSADTQTHILHLGSDGEILPHLDNLQASGTWILGVSLGTERIMRMECTDDREDSFDVLLPSGSVYLQRYANSRCPGTVHGDMTCIIGTLCATATLIQYSKKVYFLDAKLSVALV